MKGLIFAALPMLFILAVLMGARLLGEHRARRENHRRQSEYRDACAKAKRDGTLPPFPPNVVMWGP